MASVTKIAFYMFLCITLLLLSTPDSADALPCFGFGGHGGGGAALPILAAGIVIKLLENQVNHGHKHGHGHGHGHKHGHGHGHKHGHGHAHEQLHEQLHEQGHGHGLEYEQGHGLGQEHEFDDGLSYDIDIRSKDAQKKRRYS